MTVTADSKRRVIIPSARPGDLFKIQTAGEGKFTLTRLEPIQDRPNRGHFEKRGKYSVFVTERPISLEGYQLLVHRFIKCFTHYETKRSNFFQRCTTGAPLISAIPRKILSLSSALDLTRICLRNVCAILPKSVSTRLSQEPCLGVWT